MVTGNTTVSAIWNTSEGRRYNIRRWLTPGKEGTLSEDKRDPGHLKREAETMKLRFINIEDLQSKLQNTDSLDLLEKMKCVL